MSYTINLTNGSILTTVLDGTANNDSSLTLVGKNYTAYGEIIAENLIKLLENQANATAPLAPLTGELWFDSATSALKVYNGTQFKSLSVINATSTTPTSPNTADLWMDTSKNQLNFYTGTAWELVGPSYTTANTKSGEIVNTITDNGAGTHVVVEIWDANEIIAIWSKDTEFTPVPAISGFATIKPGLQLSTNVTGLLFQGTATNSQLLDSLDSTQFLRSDANDTTSGSLGVLNDTGLSVGAGSDFTVSILGNDVTLYNNTNNGLFNISVNDGGVPTTAISIDGSTTLATVTANPTAALGIATKQYVDAVTSGSAATYVELAGDTMTGALVLNADPTVTLGAATKQYVDTEIVTIGNANVTKAGDTMTGALVLNADPTVSLGAATKQYVDTEITTLKGAAPAGLDTLVEIATSINNDTNFNTTITNSIATKVPLGGGTMTGHLLLPPNASPASEQAVRKDYVDGEITTVGSDSVAKIGGTMTGFLTLSGAPSNTNHAATKAYVDGKISTLKGAAPSTLDTLQELATSLGNDVDFTGTMTTALDGKVAVAGDTMTGALVLNADPAVALGAATKQYVDAVTSGSAATYVELAGDTMTGALTLSADPTANLHSATKQYVDTATASLNNGKVDIVGDTMTGAITLAGDPTANLHAATKQYVDAVTSASSSTYVELAGDTMTGALILSANPTVALGAVTKQYVDAEISTLKGAAPVGLDSFVELATSINNDTDFNGTMTTALATKLRLAGDTMTGALVLNADPTANLHAATKQYVDAVTSASSSTYVELAGDTMTGALTLSGAPTNTDHAATKAYVDAEVAGVSLPSTSNGYGTRTVGTELPTGGASGDIHYRVAS